MSFLGVGVLSLVAACRRVDALKQRCVAGEDSACEAACDKGVAGEGGCFQAGSARMKRGALDFTGNDFKRARSYFVKSCEGRYGDGCLFAAQAIDAPYGPLDPRAPGTVMPPTISDADLAERERLLVRACDLAGGAACKRLGDVSIGRRSERAEAAYRRACEASRDPEGCKTQRGNEVRTFEAWRSACTRHVADDCTHLGDALYAIDAPRAIRLFVSECALRGVESLAGGLAAFVIDRARSASSGPGTFTRLRAAPARPQGDAPRLVPGVPEVHGSVALVAIERAVQMRSDELSNCVASLPKTARGTLKAELVVDLTGDVWRAKARESTLGPSETACLLTVLEEIEFGDPLPTPATVIQSLTLGDAGRRP